jgi:hypothetical protein
MINAEGGIHGRKLIHHMFDASPTPQDQGRGEGLQEGGVCSLGFQGGSAPGLRFGTI